MKINNIVIGTVFVLGLSFLSSPAYAEEVVEEATPVEEAPTAEPEPTYTPPPEAYEGEGAWGIVNPETGQVVDGNVCTVDVCGPDGSWGGVVPEGILIDGCPESGCVFRFQSRAEEGGNVAGYHSDGYTDVRWNEQESNYTIRDGLGRTSTLIPERTDGRGAQSGLVDIVQKTETDAGIKIEQRQEDVYDEDVETNILFPEWGEQGKLFRYLSQLEAERNLQTDIDSDLVSEGYTTEITTTETVVDEETGEETTTETTETVIDEENVFVKTVRVWTESVVEFFRGIFS